jgi:hypothetical protein
MAAAAAFATPAPGPLGAGALARRADSRRGRPGTSPSPPAAAAAVVRCAHAARFDADGRPAAAPAQPVSFRRPGAARRGAARTAAMPGGGVVEFEGGAESRGPAVLPHAGDFRLEAVLPCGGQCLVVAVEYVGGRREAFELSWDGGAADGAGDGFARGLPLEARDIAGQYVARESVRWSADSGGGDGGVVTVVERLERVYGAVNSGSATLVRMPLGVSVVAPAAWSAGHRLSFGCGWTPAPALRPVMVRTHGEGGAVEKVDWRVEERV